MPSVVDQWGYSAQDSFCTPGLFVSYNTLTLLCALRNRDPCTLSSLQKQKNSEFSDSPILNAMWWKMVSFLFPAMSTKALPALPFSPVCITSNADEGMQQIRGGGIRVRRDEAHKRPEMMVNGTRWLWEMGANLRVIRCKPKLDCVLLPRRGEGEGELERSASFLLAAPFVLQRSSNV